MPRTRLIPTLLLHDGGLWQTERFTPRTYLGDPTNAVRIFNDKEVDELIVMDVDASRRGRGPDFDLVERLASECFMPLCYSGGIRSFCDAERLFRLGVEKVGIGTALRRQPGLADEIGSLAGRQAVVGVVDVTRNGGDVREFDHVTHTITDFDWRATVRALVDHGVGELLVNCVHLDGTLQGPDLDVAEQVAARCPVPVIYSGGTRDLDDARALAAAGISAIGAGAMFVYFGPYRAVLITYLDPSDLEGGLSHA